MHFDNSFNTITRGLSLSILKHEVIADNIANVSTPGYKRKDVDFKSMLQDNMSSAKSLRMARTNDRHMQISGGNMDLKAFITHPGNTDVKSDNNNVDVDKEITGMVNNSMYYNSLITMFNRKLKILREVISERVV